jgi:hypothetical protein
VSATLRGGLKSCCHAEDPAVQPNGALAFDPQRPGTGGELYKLSSVKTYSGVKAPGFNP